MEKPYTLIQRVSAENRKAYGAFLGFDDRPGECVFSHWKSTAVVFRLTGEYYSGIPRYLGEALDALDAVMPVRVQWAHDIGPIFAAGIPAHVEATWPELRAVRAGAIEQWAASGDYLWTAESLRRFRLDPDAGPEAVEDWRAALKAAGAERARASPRHYAAWFLDEKMIMGDTLYGWRSGGRLYPSEEDAAVAYLATRGR